MGPLGLIEPLDPLVLDAKKVRAFFVTQQVWSFYNCVGMCDFVGAPLNALHFLRCSGGTEVNGEAVRAPPSRRRG